MYATKCEGIYWERDLRQPDRDLHLLPNDTTMQASHGDKTR